MEHLFKLKKDGKTVGYCKLLKYRDPLDSVRHWKGWGYSKNGKNWGQRIITFDTAHLFVCKDKNGKDVFAGDKIKALYFWPDAKKPQTITGKVDWRDETLNWVLYHTPNTPECVDLWQLFDIEIIEDKKND